ncbi:MAG: protein-disulfide reductase DsbD family protein, partial [Flavobacterium sp.]|nr:protein-disulfide reductase DsbD family protein [Flavobacterium sp.]
MKKVVLLLIVLFTQISQAQILDPVKWTQKIEKISDTEYNLVFKGTIDKDWHMYSQYTPDGGALPLEVLYEQAKGNYEAVGKAKESPYKKHFNDIFGVDEYYFENQVKIQQRIKVINPKLTQLVLKLNYQVCKESCINQEKAFTFVLPKTAAVAAIVVQDSMVADTATVAQSPVEASKPEPKETAVVPTQTNENKGWLSIFILAFLGGFAALLTPCVFPMIPMTVSFFTKQSKTPAQGKKNALIYGISIIAIYVILGLSVTAIFGADALNALSTNVWFNLIFFVLLLVFAASFLGAFEIMLPNSWANK